MEQEKKSYQIFVPRQPADIKTRLWVVGFVGLDVDSLMPHLRGMNYQMVKANNKRHAKRILKGDIKKNGSPGISGAGLSADHFRLFGKRLLTRPPPVN